MDKKFTKIDKLRTVIIKECLVGFTSLILLSLVFLFVSVLPAVFINVFFWVWCGLVVLQLITVLILVLIHSKQRKKVLVSKYNFSKDLVGVVKTTFKDCIMQEVTFENNSFSFNGEDIKYLDVIVEYSIYGDNIMMHIYLKELPDDNPLLIFIVDQDLYKCVKKFNINIEALDKEIEMLNMNYKN